jgi:ketosteroid isomerase-like protein
MTWSFDNMSTPICALALAAGAASLVSAAPAAGNEAHATAPATQFVRDFFAAFDRRDIPAIRRTFAADATIVHDDGVEQTVPELIAAVTNAEHWYSRTRKIDDCHVTKEGKIIIAGCVNRVTFKRPDGREHSVAYDETWILRRTHDGLKAIRTHYSRIRKAAHTE